MACPLFLSTRSLRRESLSGTKRPKHAVVVTVHNLPDCVTCVRKFFPASLLALGGIFGAVPLDDDSTYECDLYAARYYRARIPGHAAVTAATTRLS